MLSCKNLKNKDVNRITDCFVKKTLQQLLNQRALKEEEPMNYWPKFSNQHWRTEIQSRDTKHPKNWSTIEFLFIIGMIHNTVIQEHLESNSSISALCQKKKSNNNQQLFSDPLSCSGPNDRCFITWDELNRSKSADLKSKFGFILLLAVPVPSIHKTN